MNKHLTDNEMKKYLSLVTMSNCDIESQDFIDEVDAHVSVCSECYENLQNMRMLLYAFASNPSAAEKFSQDFSAVNEVKKSALFAIKIKVVNKMRVLADTLSDILDASFVPMQPAMAARGGSFDDNNIEINNIMNNAMIISLEDGHKASVCCRDVNNNGSITLFVYCSENLEFKLTSNGKTIPLLEKKYDELIGEYICTYSVDDGSFELSVR